MLGLILISVIAISLLSFIGIFLLTLNEELLNKILVVLIAFASGSLLGGAFLHLLPESLAFGEEVLIFILFGIITFFILEKFLYWRHCHIGKCDIHEFVELNLIGDSLHNFIDGMIIAASFLLSIPLGSVSTLAIVFHEIPQEIGDFGVLVYGGLKKRKALFYNFLSALAAVFGAAFTYIFSTQIGNISKIMLPFAAGGFIYIASSDLIPELHKRKSLRESLIQFIFLLLGIALMFFLKILF